MTEDSDELAILRKRVEEQRRELARLNALVDDLRRTFLRQSSACRGILERATADMKLWAYLMKSSEKDFTTQTGEDRD